MPGGPILIFDKSALHSLSVDEAHWLDHFFLSNITPLFFIEVLADLEKEIKDGRTPEQVVGNLAYKTPDMQSSVSAHHLAILQAELSGIAQVQMDGRILRAGGRAVQLGGKTGVIFQNSPEEEAFHRWHQREFLDIERQIAKGWRRSLSNINLEEIHAAFKPLVQSGPKPRSLGEVKAIADAFIDNAPTENALQGGMDLLGIPDEHQAEVFARWRAGGKLPVRQFAPYFRHLYGIDLFFYLAIATEFIGREKPSNKVDLAYLYYLPFCMVFTSSDKLHRRMVPLFLRSDQSYVEGSELKVSLAELDAHYSSLPADVQAKGAFSFAKFPPLNSSFLITRLWDKHFGEWREHATTPEQPQDPEAHRLLVEELNGLANAPTDPNQAGNEPHFMHVQRSVLLRKGKWRRFSPEIEKNLE
jgi:hypothetical protein